MKPKTILFAALAATLLAACSSDDETSAPAAPADPRAIRVEAIHPSAATRANDTGFDKGDRIGVYVVSDSSTLQPGGNVVNNGSFTYSGSSWVPQRSYYWNEGLHSVYAYFPYKAGIDDTGDYVFPIPSDQSSAEGYSSADFLWAKADGQSAGSDAVRLKFSHALSKVVVELEKADGYEGELPFDMQVYIHGTAGAASIDLSTGGAAADGGSSSTTIKALKLSPTRFTAIVAPQRISSRRPLVEVVTGNVSYLMEGTISLKQGYQHTLTVTLSKSPEQTEIEIGGGISGWE